MVQGATDIRLDRDFYTCVRAYPARVKANTKGLGPVTKQKAVIIGQGYVGLPVAVRAAEVGFDVVGIDIEKRRVDALQVGESFVQDIPNERLAPLVSAGSYRATSDYELAAGFDFAVITVPTPLAEGLPDLSFIEESAASLAPHVTPGATVILESTTYPGTTEELLIPILESGSGLSVDQFFVGYSPERIDPGNPTWHLENTPKVVSGVGAAALERVQWFYDQIVETTVPVSTPKEAELTKLLENTFRHVNIALINELAVFAHDLGIDVHEAIDAASSKPFGYMRFTPGPGVGGHCLPIDPAYLAWEVKRRLGRPFRFVELANDINDHMPDYVLARIGAMLNEQSRSIRGARVLAVGMAYKKNTGDMRESPAIAVVKGLLALGADVTAVEPHGDANYLPDGLAIAELSAQTVEAADLVVVLTDHDNLDWDVVADSSTPVLDTRRRVTGPNISYI